ncbi:hypothetical protein EJB05_23736 [Eragrostis curvula]|uniref:Uncharacterized protein n=1 Tax=Eragrostis curvula TaxID=38414 RepID=A0A5J9VAX7_9POAL|nr:hypothetical protein EJB05_23736 [Eragrostis curvula]
MEATQASGAGVGVQAGGSRSEEVRRRVTGQGGVVPGGGPRSGPARGVEIHGGGTRGAGATNNGGRLRREERLRHAAPASGSRPVGAERRRRRAVEPAKAASRVKPEVAVLPVGWRSMGMEAAPVAPAITVSPRVLMPLLTRNRLV